MKKLIFLLFINLIIGQPSVLKNDFKSLDYTYEIKKLKQNFKEIFYKCNELGYIIDRAQERFFYNMQVLYEFCTNNENLFLKQYNLSFARSIYIELKRTAYIKNKKNDFDTETLFLNSFKYIDVNQTFLFINTKIFYIFSRISPVDFRYKVLNICRDIIYKDLIHKNFKNLDILKYNEELNQFLKSHYENNISLNYIIIRILTAMKYIN